MDTAGVQNAALQLPADGLGEPHVGVAHHQTHACEAAFFEGSDELAPGALGLAVAHLEAQQLTAALGIDAHANDHGSGLHL